jgi:hypothetical protein
MHFQGCLYSQNIFIPRDHIKIHLVKSPDFLLARANLDPSSHLIIHSLNFTSKTSLHQKHNHHGPLTSSPSIQAPPPLLPLLPLSRAPLRPRRRLLRPLPTTNLPLPNRFPNPLLPSTQHPLTPPTPINNHRPIPTRQPLPAIHPQRSTRLTLYFRFKGLANAVVWVVGCGFWAFVECEGSWVGCLLEGLGVEFDGVGERGFRLCGGDDEDVFFGGCCDGRESDGRESGGGKGKVRCLG